jgi:hypothetical protein
MMPQVLCVLRHERKEEASRDSATERSLHIVFGAEDALEAGARKLNAYQVFTSRGKIHDMDHPALRGEVRLDAARGVVGKRDADFEIGADGHVETRDERGAAAAEIFAGSVFFKDNTAAVATPHFQREADGDSTLRALLRGGLRQMDHGRGPLFRRSLGSQHLGQPQRGHSIEQPTSG